MQFMFVRSLGVTEQNVAKQRKWRSTGHQTSRLIRSAALWGICCRAEDDDGITAASLSVRFPVSATLLPTI